jgi:hypothetical protein
MIIIPLFNVLSQLSWEWTVVACCPFSMFAPLMSLVTCSFSIGSTRPKTAATLPPMSHLDPIPKAAQLTSTPLPSSNQNAATYVNRVQTPGVTKRWKSKNLRAPSIYNLFLNRPLFQTRRSGEAAAQTVRAKAQSVRGWLDQALFPCPWPHSEEFKIRVKLERRLGVAKVDGCS